MINIDPYYVVNSFEKALVPKPNLVDGRDDKDRLSFLVNFASLINFYDKQNNINGSWQPFLLKDPVILVASIAKIPFKQQYNNYVAGIEELAHVITQDTIDQEALATALNQLFPLITGVYTQIEQWTEFMKRAPLDYTLKSYTIDKLEEQYAAIFWATLSLQEYLATQGKIENVVPVDWDLYTSYDQKIWKSSKDREPFWEVLGLYFPSEENDFETFQEYVKTNTVDGNYTLEFLGELYDSLKYSGDQTYTFYKKMVEYAWVEYDEIIFKKDQYPDTLLVRTFVDLMNVYKDQVNTLAKKHLKFYYRDILKQKKELASPDHVFAAADLSFEDGTYLLYKDVLFNAGENENAETILFKSVKDTSLNSGAITNVYTLSADETSLFVNPIENVGEKQVDENGTIQSWSTFGTQEVSGSIAMSFMMASPMLFLGLATQRAIVISIALNEEVETSTFRSADYFLSTTEEWFEVFPEFLEETPEKTDFLTFTIELDLSVPPIAPFAEDAEVEVHSLWPLLKITFNEYSSLNNPPQIKTLEITTDVQETLNINLYNDFGALSPEEPFQLFGTTPEKNQNFFIGSNEVFSKPVNDIQIQVNWDNLPPEGFCTYYKEYNDYLHPEDEEPCPETILESNGFVDIILVFLEWLISLLKGKKKLPKDSGNNPDPDPDPNPNPPVISWKDYRFSNTSFTIKFQQLVENTWKEFLSAFNTNLLYRTNEEENILTIEPLSENFMRLKLSNLGKINLEVLVIETITYTTSFEGNMIDIVVDNLVGEIPIQVESDLVVIQLQEEHDITITFHSEDEEKEIEALGQTIIFTIPSLAPVEILHSSSDYYCEEANDIDTIITDPNPVLQLTNPLEFTETTTSGFMRIQLTSDYGFGASLYPKVISSVALYNAAIIAQIANDSTKVDESDLEAQPNIPYIPLVGGFSLSYKATKNYDFTKDIEYPVECYYTTPFSTYKVFDNAEGLFTNGTTLVSPAKDVQHGIPMYPELASKGNLLIPLQNLIFPAELSLYFELANNDPKATGSPSLEYHYLTENGWKKLQVLYDGTLNLTCSGIITLSLQNDMTDKFPTLPQESYYISISLREKASNYSKTSFLKTNGFELVRAGDNYQNSTEIPWIPAETITEPQEAIPQIATVVQPFPSFGGKAKETSTHKDIRVATRITTKDRVITQQDYYRTIQLSFQEIYFSKILYDKESNETQIFLVKKVEDWKDASAFLPLVSTCVEKEVKDYLNDRASGLVDLNVFNFEIKYVKILGDIKVASGYSIGEVAKLVKEQLNVFISPWIVGTNQDQIQVDSGLTTSEIANFIKQNEAISSIDTLLLQIGSKDLTTGVIHYECLSVYEIEVATKNQQIALLKNLCKIIDFIVKHIEPYVFTDDKMDAILPAPNPFRKELSEKFQNKIHMDKVEADKVTKEILDRMGEINFKTLGRSEIRTAIEKVFESLEEWNTAYISQKTLLAPSLDDSSLNFI